MSRTQGLKGITGAADNRAVGEPVTHGSAGSRLVTSDSVISQEPGTVWLRMSLIAEDPIPNPGKLCGAARRC